RVGLVRTVEEFRSTIGVSIQWLVLEVGILLPAKRDSLLCRYIHIHRKGILALMLRVKRRCKPVTVDADIVGKIWHRPRVQDPDSVPRPSRRTPCFYPC